MNFFDQKNLGNHLLQLCPKVVKHPVYVEKCLGRNVFGLKVEFSYCTVPNGRKLMHRIPSVFNNGKYLNPIHFFDRRKTL